MHSYNGAIEYVSERLDLLHKVDLICPFEIRPMILYRILWNGSRFCSTWNYLSSSVLLNCTVSCLSLALLIVIFFDYDMLLLMNLERFLFSSSS